MGLTIAEMNSDIWDLRPTFSWRADRSGSTVADFLEDRGVRWVQEGEKADVHLYKGGVGGLSISRVLLEARKRLMGPPAVTLLGEPRELAEGEYRLASHKSSLAVAPGAEFERLFFANVWTDPQLDGWKDRLDRICWIGRPTPERIEIARRMVDRGVPLDIYSRSPWPFPNWKGFAEDELLTARRYRYRIVSENYSTYGYHSEKLFNSLRAGCVTLYQGDSQVDLSHLGKGFLRLENENLEQRSELASGVLEGIEAVMFSEAWEVYSLRAFYVRLLKLVERVLD